MAAVNFQNRTLYHGDNLAFLRGMNSETVHLIATDPPFNKNKDFHATPDSIAAGARFKDRWKWDKDVEEEWIDDIQDDWPAVWEVIGAARAAYGDDMGAFLCWLGVRLMEMHRVLRPDGSLYLHIDHTAHAYVKALLDAIFGVKNFRNEIVWLYTGPGSPKMRQFNRKHDTILWYNKGKSWTFNRDDVRLPYKDPNQRPRKAYDTGGSFTPEAIEAMRKRGKVAEDWWQFRIVARSKRENTGYPTQKPLALYRRIIKASSNKGDIVLDPFCGCATTPIAAEQLERQWIGMDIWDGAYQIVLERLEQEKLVVRQADKAKQPHLITFGDVHYETKPPIRTDDNEIAAPMPKLKIQRPKEPWQKITHKQIVKVLTQAQGTINGVICAGCGRVLEKEFMELDHITPKSEGGRNDISNRVLLCRPCNGRKRDNFTLKGLRRENKKVGWTKDAGLAKLAQDKARGTAEWVRDYFDTDECRALMAGDKIESL